MKAERTTRIVLELTGEDRRWVEAAAKARGMKVVDFVEYAATDNARGVLSKVYGPCMDRWPLNS